MQIRLLEDGSLRILLVDTELSRLGIDFSALQQRDAPIDGTIRRIVKAACAKAGILPPRKIAVTARSVNGGCLLSITPHPLPPPNEGVHVFSLPDSNSATSLIAALHPYTDILSASLFAYEGYRLLIYSDRLSDRTVRIIREFAVPTAGGALAAARITEHGTPLAIALERV